MPLTRVAWRDDVPASKAPDALDQACRQVESLFINELLSAMGRQSFGEGVLGGGAAREVLEAQRNAALAEEMGRRGELGVARILYEQLSRGVRTGGSGAQADVANTGAQAAAQGRTGREEMRG